MLLYKRSDISTFCKDPKFRIYTDYAAWAKAEYEYAKMVLDKIKAAVMASAIAELRQKCKDSTNKLLHFPTGNYPAYFPGYVYKPPLTVAPTFFTNRELRERGIVPPIQFYSQEAPYEEVANIPEIIAAATEAVTPEIKAPPLLEEVAAEVKVDILKTPDTKEKTSEDEQSKKKLDSSEISDATEAVTPEIKAPPLLEEVATRGAVVPSIPQPVLPSSILKTGATKPEKVVDVESDGIEVAIQSATVPPASMLSSSTPVPKQIQGAAPGSDKIPVPVTLHPVQSTPAPAVPAIDVTKKTKQDVKKGDTVTINSQDKYNGHQGIVTKLDMNDKNRKLIKGVEVEFKHDGQKAHFKLSEFEFAES